MYRVFVQIEMLHHECVLVVDADVLLVEGWRVDEEDLTVPHPRLWERRFVVQPLGDLAPDLVTAAQLRASGGRVVAVGSL